VYLDKVRELSKNLNIKTVQLALWWILQNGVIPIAGSNDYNRNIINLNSFVLTLPNNIKNELDIIIETMPTNVTTKNFNNNDRIKRYK
jgi:aryl-alcohol dehydrogenase-like predicted oxidoreductase